MGYYCIAARRWTTAFDRFHRTAPATNGCLPCDLIAPKVTRRSRPKPRTARRAVCMPVRLPENRTARDRRADSR